MFCAQCGKRVIETMLFCPFCGAAIVIPEQDMQDAQAGDGYSFAPPNSPVAQEISAKVSEASSDTEPVGEADAADDSSSDAILSAEPLHVSSSQTAQAVQGGGETSAVSWSHDVAGAGKNASVQVAVDYTAPNSPGSRYGKRETQTAQDEHTGADISSSQPTSGGVHPASLFDDVRQDVDEVPATIRYTKATDRIMDVRRNADRPHHGQTSAVATSDERRDGKPARDTGKAQPDVQRSGKQARRQDESQHRRSYIPVRDVDVNDLFMDDTRPGSGESLNDAFDDGDFEDERFEYEEREDSSFFQRHIRGMVGLMLTLVLIVVLAIWACLPGGQRTLASLNLAWNAEVYNELGHDAYDAGQPAQAAEYFDRALALDDENYDYAQSAMVAHYEAGNVDKAFELLKRCIDLRPGDASVYAQLLILFPNPDTRPWEASELLREGYERTGEESLNVSPE